MERLDVTILGKDYPLACEPSEKEALLTAATMVDRAMQRIKAGGKVAGTERIAVMAALQLAAELMNANSPTHDLQSATTSVKSRTCIAWSMQPWGPKRSYFRF